MNEIVFGNWADMVNALPEGLPKEFARHCTPIDVETGGGRTGLILHVLESGAGLMQEMTVLRLTTMLKANEFPIGITGFYDYVRCERRPH